jgi:hypothetical protein
VLIENHIADRPFTPDGHLGLRGSPALLATACTGVEQVEIRENIPGASASKTSKTPFRYLQNPVSLVLSVLSVPTARLGILPRMRIVRVITSAGPVKNSAMFCMDLVRSSSQNARDGHVILAEPRRGEAPRRSRVKHSVGLSCGTRRSVHASRRCARSHDPAPESTADLHSLSSSVFVSAFSACSAMTSSSLPDLALVRAMS